MTRDDYLAKAKTRALEYLDCGEVDNAITSILSDLNQRADTKVNDMLAIFGLKIASDANSIEARRFIEGFR